jgi:glutamate dehydrogenase (NADP+)
MLKTRGESLDGKVCLVSGSGNVSQFTVEKLTELGARPITLSDSNGMIHDPDGIGPEKLAWVMDLKNRRRGRIAEYVERFKGARYVPVAPGAPSNPLWDIPADCAFRARRRTRSARSTRETC